MFIVSLNCFLKLFVLKFFFFDENNLSHNLRICIQSYPGMVDFEKNFNIEIENYRSENYFFELETGFDNIGF